MIIFIISILIYIIGVTADTLTTKANNDDVGGMYEANSRYRLPNGDADMKKLIRDKFILGAICAAVSFALYFSGLDFTPLPRGISFILFAVVGARHIQVALANRKIAEKLRKK